MTATRRMEEIMVIVIPEKVKVGDRDGIWHRISATLCDVFNELNPPANNGASLDSYSSINGCF